MTYIYLFSNRLSFFENQKPCPLHTYVNKYKYGGGGGGVVPRNGIKTGRRTKTFSTGTGMSCLRAYAGEPRISAQLVPSLLCRSSLVYDLFREDHVQLR